MTTALPHPNASLRPLPDTRHLHLVADGVRHDAEDPASPPLVGYLLLVPQGTDPLDLLVKDRPRPEFRPADDAVRIDTARRTAEVDGRELDLKAPDWYLGLACGLGGLIGGYLGARLQPRLPETGLRLLLGSLATAVGVLYAVQALG